MVKRHLSLTQILHPEVFGAVLVKRMTGMIFIGHEKSLG
jgi:hypothetical protein